MSPTCNASDASSSPSTKEITLDDVARALLEEAKALLGAEDHAPVLAQALEEFVQRQRFLALVTEHETAGAELA